MTPQRALLALLLLFAGGCGERAAQDRNSKGSTTPAYERADNGPLFKDAEIAVRIGELGSGFAACNARGALRDRAAVSAVPVSAAPFDQAQEIDRLPRGAEFFICSRTHDQRWVGIVYDEGGQASDRCGVSEPVSVRRDYSGPCSSGWVASNAVRLISGIPHQLQKESPPSD